ncbi:ABC transporter substrate-binding protein [Paraclostridium sordellii]|uniref:ABC transporter substrate-binding protein n=1 Tax=Paraclostridium sordellii TaxID=1505 RepID=UPI0005DE9686|nr:ABC transporter substrate-binding protein [Paeniclostridium sordellii]CEO29695.1 oligopeptide transporter [[Clostridium] sordellii] [Paeniclostridium sordellii]CEP46553.1 oligopeptide transporter [[Clostridium] sordellii] [Paeniclostridium sordellii]
MLFKKKISCSLLVILMSTISLYGCEGKDLGKQDIESKELLKNKDARLAITMAIDKEKITNVILNNGSSPINYYTPEGLAIDNHGKDYRDIAGNMGNDYDLKEAKEHWEKAREDLNFKNVTIEVLTSDAESSKRVGEFFQNQLQTNLDGLKVELKQVPFKQKQQLESEGDYDLVYSSWVADYPDPLTFLETFTTNGKFGKNSGYDSKEYNALIEEGKNATSISESWNKYAKAEEILLSDAFLMPLFQSSSAYIQKPYVDGITIIPYGAKYAYKWANAEDKNELNLTSNSDIPSLDMSKATDSLSFSVANNVMEGLVRVNNDGEVVEGIAKEWKSSEDKKTWTFYLRKDAVWSNGDPVTAKDFEFGFKRTLNPKTASQYGFIMYDIVGAENYNIGKTTDSNSIGIKAIDNYTLEVKLNRPVNYFDRLMSFPVFFPQNEKFVKEQGDKFGTTEKTTLYNGPFTLTKWKLDDVYIMTKNQGYWDKNTIRLESVNTKIVKEGTADVNLYENGDVDFIGISNEFIDKYKESIEFSTSKNATTFFMLINGNNK